MLSNSFKSKYVLLDSINATDNQAFQFGQNVQWVGTDLFLASSNIGTPFITDDISFTDGAYFDGGSTRFGQLFSSSSQKIDVFQVLKTDRSWIDATDDIINTVPVTTIPITGNNNVNSVYTGAIDNVFVGDMGNPDEAIKIFNNPTLTHGWAAFTSQQSQRILTYRVCR